MTTIFTRENLSKLSARDMKLLIWRQKWLMTARPKQLPPDITDHGNGLDPDWTEWGIMSGRGWGKLGDVEIPVPTPDGWRRLGDIDVGARVFDETGAPCNVLETFDDTPQIAYRLTFSDDTTIDCCGDHQWVTWTHRDRKEYLRQGLKTDFPDDWPKYRQVLPRYGDVVGPEVRTTQEIVDTLHQETKRGDLNHCIPLCKPLRYEEKVLPLDPWAMGYWLGNGSTNTGQVSCHQDDVDEVQGRFEALGFMCKRLKNGRDFYVSGLLQLLREIGVLGNKHAPDIYLQGSVDQRRAFLAGLIDSDGHCAPSSGHIEFCSMDRGLADAVMELARSLGQRPVMSTGRAMLNGVDHGEKYRPKWRPLTNPFGLPRKGAAFRPLASQALRSRHRMIISAERIDPKPMRCLTVDSPNSMFLWGEGMLPTHNSNCGSQWLAYEAIMDPQALPSAVIAPTLNDVRYTNFEGTTGILSLIPPEIVKDYNKTNLIITLDNDAVIRGFSAEEPERLRGPQFGRVLCDEVAAWLKDEDCWNMMMFGLRLGPNPKVVWTTTPKPKDLIRKLIEKKAHRHITRGSTYENRANLAGSFFDQLVQYEGTQLGRQELEGELIDAEEGGIISRSWIRLWPAKNELPSFEWIIMSLDTAFTEKTLDRKSHNADETACTVWGVFHHNDKRQALLLDCWAEQLGFPDLMKKVKREMKIAYGSEKDSPMLRPLIGPQHMQGAGRTPDILLIEDKGSGISLRQALEREGIVAYAYNPGRADKLTRLHMVSHLFAQGLVWVPESNNYPGRPRTWVEPMIAQLCSFRGPGSIRRDDFVDSVTQAARLMLDKNLLVVSGAPKKDTDSHAAEREPVRVRRENPYAA